MEKEKYGRNYRLGVLGGGQLGRMMIQEAISMDIEVHVLDPNENAPCSEIANTFTQGDFNDYDTVLDFGQDKDLVTIEIEHVNTKALKELASKGVAVYPEPEILEMIQDKGLQKDFYAQNEIPTAAYQLVDDPDAFTPHAFPLVQKTRKGGYDGKGVKVLKNQEDWDTNRFPVPSVIEDAIDIEKELSVIVASNSKGEVKTFPVVELVFDPRANLVDYLICPAEVNASVEEKAQTIAKDLMKKLGMTGLLAVELFLTKKGEILVNEVAPRTHNSGHQSIEGNFVSQFGQHLRAILNFPLGDTTPRCTSLMWNILGDPDHKGPVKYEGLEHVLSLPGVYPHIYGKTETKPYRKMGHITLLGKDRAEVLQKLNTIKENFKVISH